MAKTNTKKIRYRINTKNNQLLILRDQQKFYPSGRLEIDDKNRLTYLYQRKDIDPVDWDIPRKIVFEGKWVLDRRNTLLYVLRKSADVSFRQKVYLKGEICDVEANSLAVAVTTTEEDQVTRVQQLKLEGTWRADESNRLNFLVERLRSRYDMLTFEGGWQVENNAIVYTVQDVSLKRGERVERKLTFKGFWEINDARHVTYVLDRNSNSVFNFRLFAGSPNLIAKKGVLKYRVGTAVAGTRQKRVKEITLFGTWKFSDKGELGFEMGNHKTIMLRAAMPVFKRNKMVFQIEGKKGERFKRSVVFERGFLKNNAQMSLELSEDVDRNRKICAGVKVRW